MRLEGTSRAHLVQPPPLHKTVSRHTLCISQPPEQPLQVLGHPHGKKKKKCVFVLSLLCVSVSIASGSVTGHCWKKSVSFFITVFLQVFICINKILLSILSIHPHHPPEKGCTQYSPPEHTTNHWHPVRLVLLITTLWAWPLSHFSNHLTVCSPTSCGWECHRHHCSSGRKQPLLSPCPPGKSLHQSS